MADVWTEFENRYGRYSHTGEQRNSYEYGWNDAKEDKVLQYYAFFTEDEHTWYERGYNDFKESENETL